MKDPEDILFVVEDALVDQAAAVERALTLVENNQARLTVMSVLPKPRLGLLAGKLTAAAVESRIVQVEQQRLEGLFGSELEREDISTQVCIGIPFIEVVRDVLANGRDLVIKAAGDGGPHDFLFGGIDQHLLRKCPCPVWLLCRETTGKYRRILAAVDLDPWGDGGEDNGLNDVILEWAASLALSEFAELHVVHAWKSISDQMRPMFDSDLSDMQARKIVERERRAYHDELQALGDGLRGLVGGDAHAYLSPRLHLRKGNARKVVPELAVELEADILVMGTLSRAGIPGYLIGNTAEEILNNVACSVLAVKPSGFVSPIAVAD